MKINDRLREEWRATSGPARVVLSIVGAVFLLWGTYMVWFALSYRF